MGISAVASVIGEGIAADVVGGALTGAVISGVTGGDIGMGALTGGIGGGIMGGLGMGGGVLNYGNTSVGSLFGATPTGSLMGSAGTTMDQAAVNDAIQAYVNSGVPYETAAQYVATATGNSVGAVMDVASGASGGLGLVTAAQGAIPRGATSALGALTSGAKMGTMGNIANLAQVGSGVYNLMNPPQSPQAATSAADPWSQYRSQAASSLNQLMQNPNMVYGMPGYQFAQQQGAKNIQRQAAATGQAVSGGTLASLQQQGATTAQNWFNQYVNTLGTQAGVSNANLGVQAGQFAQNQQNATQTAALQNIMAGAAGLSAGFFG